MKRVTSFFLILILLTGLACRAGAQTIDDQLTWNDYFVMQQFSFYPRDNRYNYYLVNIAQNLNGAIVDTFGEDKDITFYVCPSPLGFNAVAFHRFIVFDSLLLDSLRFLAMGKIYYGNLNNEYFNRLARKVVEVTESHRSGYSNADYSNMDNPFGLPKPGNLSQAQLQQADELFTNILASWMAHEGSHCMRDHLKYRLQAMHQSNQHFYPQGDKNQFNNSVAQYTNAKISQELEKDADVHAVAWLINAGYDEEGFVTWLKFGEKLEALMGQENAYLRTHPKCSERIQYIKQAVRNLTDGE